MKATALEAAFGDPFDGGGATGFAAIVRADDRGEPPAACVAVMDSAGIGAACVPAALGGRLEGLPGLVRALRPAFRRDVGLGFGHGFASFMAAMNVWTAGSAAQRRRLADTLLDAGRASVAFHALDHGADVVHNDLLATFDGARISISGEARVIPNVERAAALVLFVRTDPRPDGRGHSVLLLDPDELDARHVRRLPAGQASGLRGCELGAIRLDAAGVSAERIVGERGAGTEIQLRTLQITRSALPAMALGALDSALRVTLSFARDRKLYGTTAAALPHARATLAGVFADLLACDALAAITMRALHLAPADAGVLAAATSQLVPRVMLDALYELSVVLGARCFLREGEHAVFQKIVRDVPLLSLGHGGNAAARGAVLHHLPPLVRSRSTDAAPGLFRLADALPPLRPEELSLGAAQNDVLVGDLGPALGALDGRADTVGESLLDVHARLYEERGDADERDLDCAARYAILAAASACGNVWHAQRDRDGASIADPAWVRGALARLAGRLTGASAVLDPELQEALFAELVRRHDAGRSFDLDDSALAGAEAQ